MDPIRLAEYVAGGGAAALFGGIGIYAFVSFVLSYRFGAKRTRVLALRSFLRELWIAGLTQPILPLYYLLGRRMASGQPGGVPIVFVHGYMQNRVGFLGLSRALAKHGLGPMYGFNYPWFVPIASNARRLERFVTRVCEETKSNAVDLVCHSMGGLVAMEMMSEEAKAAPPGALRVRRCVTIASPHAGVMWRGPLLGIGATSLRRGSKLLTAHAQLKASVPTLSIFSTNDNIVFPKATSSLALRGGRDLEVEGEAHLAILFSPRVSEHVASFLSEKDPV